MATTMQMYAVGPEERDISPLTHLASMQVVKNILEGKQTIASLEPLPREMKKYIKLFLKNPTSLEDTLIDAAKISGNYVKNILSTGVSPNIYDDMGANRPLHWAARNGIDYAVEVLLKAGAIVDVQNCLGNTPLMLAAKRGNSHVVQLLVEHGANVDIINVAQQTAAILAIVTNHNSIAIYLIEHGATDFYNSYWLVASNIGNLEIMQFLLSKGVKIDLSTTEGFTALHYATLKNNIKEVEFLINNHATIDIADGADQTPLHDAAKKDTRIDILTLLLDHKASINALDIYGQTPLIDAARKNAIANTYFLLTRGADASIRDIHNNTALDYARDRNYQEIINLLEEAEQRQKEKEIL